MYTAHYGLREKPFRLTPDPRFYFLSESHREALAHVVYGIEQGEGFICVTGEVGTGKTTLCRTLVERLDADTETACLLNPRLSPDELLRAVAEEFGLDVAHVGRGALIERLNAFLLETSRRGRRALLVVDEAQTLPIETLEQIRLLSNLETATAKLIQIVLFGQPELDEKLDAPVLRQLRQRISVRWRLGVLTEAEASDYVRHRVRVASGRGAELFTPRALREIRRRARGIPRLVNVLADRSLLAGYADGAARVDRAHVGTAAREILAMRRPSRRGPGWRRVGFGAVLLAASGAALLATSGALAWRAAVQMATLPDSPGRKPVAAVAAPPPPAPELPGWTSERAAAGSAVGADAIAGIAGIAGEDSP
jgi:general secretion pathway protein A